MNFPTNTRLVPKSINFVSKTQASSFTSPFGGQQQVVRYSGQWWELDCQFAPLFEGDAQELWGFLNGLNGTDGTFNMKLPDKFMMSGSLSLTITGNGNTFTETSGQIGKFGVDGSYRLVQFTGTSSLFPRLPTGGATIGTTNGALYRLASNDLSVSVDEMMSHGISIGIREAI